MSNLLINVACVASATPIWVSLWFFDRLIRMESKITGHRSCYGAPAVGIFSLVRDRAGRCLEWADIKALIRGLQLYFIWLFRMPLWVRNDLGARRAIWVMRSLFWLTIVGMEVVKETLL